MCSRRHQELSVAILHHCSTGALLPCRAEQPCGVRPLQSYGTQKELPAWLPQCFKPDFTLLAMKYRHGFCFTSVIAYNSMKLQPELISLAADKGSCQVWQHAITQGIGRRGLPALCPVALECTGGCAGAPGAAGSLLVVAGMGDVRTHKAQRVTAVGTPVPSC